jgi:hypothetical protein
VRAKFPLQKSSFSLATAPEKVLIAIDRAVNDRPVGKPQEEGMMNIAASFSLSKKPRFVDPVGKRQTQEGDAC